MHLLPHTGSWHKGRTEHTRAHRLTRIGVCLNVTSSHRTSRLHAILAPHVASARTFAPLVASVWRLHSRPELHPCSACCPMSAAKRRGLPKPLHDACCVSTPRVAAASHTVLAEGGLLPRDVEPRSRSRRGVGDYRALNPLVAVASPADLRLGNREVSLLK